MSRVIEPGAGDSVWIGGLGVQFKLRSSESGGTVAIVEHPLKPKALGAPLHRHAREDELSYVLEGRVGVQVGEDVVHASPGAYVFKPRSEWHSFWNLEDAPARVLEVITPGGFESYFDEIAEVFAQGLDPARLVQIAGKFGLDIDIASVPRLQLEHGLVTA